MGNFVPGILFTIRTKSGDAKEGILFSDSKTIYFAAYNIVFTEAINATATTLLPLATVALCIYNLGLFFICH